MGPKWPLEGGRSTTLERPVWPHGVIQGQQLILSVGDGDNQGIDEELLVGHADVVEESLAKHNEVLGDFLPVDMQRE